MSKKVLAVFGTRPEAIKMCPVIAELKRRSGLQTIVCTTGQHREMLEGVLEAFSVAPDIDLSLMQTKQSLASLTSRILTAFEGVLDKEEPDAVLVHGDTTTTFAAALTAFYKKIPVGHVEAGLRTYDLNNPFPEEYNRQAVSLLASWHFAPTESAKKNLIKEGTPASSVFVTGNTAIDALKTTVRADFEHPILSFARGSRLILATAHRRESWGRPLAEIFRAIRRVADENEDVRIVLPLHANPLVRKIAHEELDASPHVLLTEPFDVLTFHNLLARCHLVLTDSGGIQEEAPFLGKPVLVLRKTTERPEGVSCGTLKLVGTDEQEVYLSFSALLRDGCAYESMAKAVNPYGDGQASKRIADVLECKLL